MPCSCCQVATRADVDAECDCCFDAEFAAKTTDMTAGYLSSCHFITVDWQTFFQRAQWLLDQVCSLLSVMSRPGVFAVSMASTLPCVLLFEGFVCCPLYCLSIYGEYKLSSPMY